MITIGRLLTSALRAGVASAAAIGIGSAGALRAQQPAAPTCGRVVAVSCTGPSSAVNLLLALPSASRNVTVVIPAEHRPLFGSRIENRFDRRQVCVAPASPAVDGGDQSLTVRSTDRLVVTGDAQPAGRLPDDVYRTCDADVELPIVLHPVYRAVHVGGDAGAGHRPCRRSGHCRPRWPRPRRAGSAAPRVKPR